MYPVRDSNSKLCPVTTSTRRVVGVSIHFSWSTLAVEYCHFSPRTKASTRNNCASVLNLNRLNMAGDPPVQFAPTRRWCEERQRQNIASAANKQRLNHQTRSRLLPNAR